MPMIFLAPAAQLIRRTLNFVRVQKVAEQEVSTSIVNPPSRCDNLAYNTQGTVPS